MNTTDVQGTLREMWETRPARPRQDRQIAGVASAIARRYDIDPVLVRIGFVVAAFTGIGAALYIAGWALLPEEQANPADPVQRRSPRRILVVGLVIATIIGLGSLFDGNVDGSAFFSTLAVAALLFLLHRSRSDRGAVGVTPRGDTPVSGEQVTGVSLLKEPVDATETIGRPTPPAWDPLGAAPFAWDLPEPSPVPAAPVRRRLPVTPVTLGLALIAGAATAGIMLLAGAFTPANLPVLFGVVLAVIGLGLVVGAFVRSGRGLIPFAVLLGVLTWATVAAPLDRWHAYQVDDLRAAPTTVAALLPNYDRPAGDIDLDLRRLDLAPAAGSTDTSPVRTSVSLGAGDVQVWVPRDADLTLTGSVGVGQISFEGRSQAGPGSELQVVDDLGADGVRSGRPLVLDIETGAGNVEVHRG